MGPSRASIYNYSQLPSMVWSGMAKNIQRSQSHSSIGFADTISSSFSKKGTRLSFGVVRRKDFAACDYPGHFCSSPPNRYNFYAFQSLLELLTVTCQLFQLPSGPIASSLNQSRLCFWPLPSTGKCLLSTPRTLPNISKLAFNYKGDYLLISANFYALYKLQEKKI